VTTASPSCSVPFPVPPGYPALRTAAAWAGLPGRTTIRVAGRDAVRFLDNFTTGALAPLAPGQGTEGFFTDARGWVIALATLLRTEDGLVIDAPPGPATLLCRHLEHYHIREDVELLDVSGARAGHALAGPLSAAWIEDRSDGPPPARPLDHVRMRLGGIEVLVARVDGWGSAGFLVQSSVAEAERLERWFAAEGLPRADDGAIEAVRIEERYPHPADIPERTLPQELDRTARAISFVKGCYLGQETVARIDALGHVNRALALVAIDASAPPAADASVTCDGEPVGVITSSTMSPRHGAAIGLAIVHRRGLAASAALRVNGLPARVVPSGAAGDGSPGRA